MQLIFSQLSDFENENVCQRIVCIFCEDSWITSYIPTRQSIYLTSILFPLATYFDIDVKLG